MLSKAASNHALMPLNELPGPKISATPCAAQLTGVGVGDDAPTEDEHLVEATITQFLHDTWEQGEVCATEQ